MQIAWDKDSKRIHIDKAERGGDYFCPTCGAKMIVKKGEVRIHHFAHAPGSICSDHWHYDMSEWHLSWQNRFPENTQEIVKIKDHERHRADVLLEDKKIVIEFQHSPLSAEEFEDRNSFYASLGYKIIWVFDLIEEFHDDSIKMSLKNSSVYRWSRPIAALKDFDPRESDDVTLYFQTSEVDEKCPIDEQDPIIVQAKWVSDQGFRIFALNDQDWLTLEEFLSLFLDRPKKTQPSTIKKKDIYDELPKAMSIDHTSFFFGCPLSSSHFSIDTDWEVRDEKYRACSKCEYHGGFEEEGTLCGQRIRNLKLPVGADIVDYETSYGFVRKITYRIEGIIYSINLPEPHYESEEVDSIMNLWKKKNLSVGVFKNLKTGWYAKIYKDPIDSFQKYGKVYGILSRSPYIYRGESREIKYPSFKCWVLARKK